jgi:hypothetical protein
MPFDDTGSPARQELFRLNEAIAAATAERDRAQEVVDRLSLPVTNLDKAIAELTAVRSEYDRRISAWYADGCPGCRPDESADLAALENTVRQLTQDGNASRPALPMRRARWMSRAPVSVPWGCKKLQLSSGPPQRPRAHFSRRSAGRR